MDSGIRAASRLLRRWSALLGALVVLIVGFVLGVGFAIAATSAAIDAMRTAPTAPDTNAVLLLSVQSAAAVTAAGIVPLLVYLGAIVWIVLPSEWVGVPRAFWRSLRRLPQVAAGAVLQLLASSALLLLGLVSVPLGPAAPVLWLLARRGARDGRPPAVRLRRWAIAATPFGPLVYWLVAWSQWLPRVVVQGAGPVAALRGSAAAVRLDWRGVASAILPVTILAAAALAVGTLVAMVGELQGWDARLLTVLDAVVALPLFAVAAAIPVAAMTGIWVEGGGVPPARAMRPRSWLVPVGMVLVPVLVVTGVLGGPAAPVLAADSPAVAEEGGPVALAPEEFQEPSPPAEPGPSLETSPEPAIEEEPQNLASLEGSSLFPTGAAELLGSTVTRLDVYPGADDSYQVVFELELAGPPPLELFPPGAPWEYTGFAGEAVIGAGTPDEARVPALFEVCSSEYDVFCYTADVPAAVLHSAAVPGELARITVGFDRDERIFAAPANHLLREVFRDRLPAPALEWLGPTSWEFGAEEVSEVRVQAVGAQDAVVPSSWRGVPGWMLYAGYRGPGEERPRPLGDCAGPENPDPTYCSHPLSPGDGARTAEAALDLRALPPGAWIVEYYYGGDAAYQDSLDALQQLAVTVIDPDASIRTTTSLRAMSTPSWGSPFTLRAEVRLRESGDPAAGSVDFLGPAGEVLPGGEGVVVDAQGRAELLVPASMVGAGPQTFTARFHGETSASASEASLTITVGAGAPTLHWSPRSEVLQGEYPLGALSMTVGDAEPADGTVVSLLARRYGELDFVPGSDVAGRAVLVDGAGTVVWDDALEPGLWQLSASTTASAEVQALSLTHAFSVVTTAQTRIVEAAVAPAAPSYGETLELAATIESLISQAPPEGEAVFSWGGIELGRVQLMPGDPGRATARLSPRVLFAPVGTHRVFVHFIPSDDRFQETSGFLGEPFEITPAQTQLVLDVEEPSLGAEIEVIARLSAIGPASDLAPPNGTVRFDITGPLERSLFATVVDGVATMPPLPVDLAGTYTVAASFTPSSSSPGFWAGSSTTVTVPVGLARATVLATAPSLVEFGQALLVPVALEAPVPLTGGTVRLHRADNGEPVGEARAVLDGTVRLSVDSALLPGVGEWPLEVRYSGNANILPAVSPPITVKVLRQSFTVEIRADRADGVVLVAEPAAYTARVRNAAGAVPIGSVHWFAGDAPLGTSVIDGTGDSAFSTVPAATWSGELEARFVPADASIQATASGTLDVTWVQAPVAVEVYGPSGGADKGSPARFTARVAMTGHPIPSAPPGGVVQITASSGESCLATLEAASAEAAQGGCELTIARAGAIVVTAGYAGQGGWAAGASEPLTQHVGKGSADLDLWTTDPVERWVDGVRVEWAGGDTSVLQWRVAGPSDPQDSGAITIRRGSVILCSSEALSGSCTVTIPELASGATYTLEYAGDADHRPASTQLSRAVTPCYPVQYPEVRNAGGGIVELVTVPNCAPTGTGATGYLSGTYLWYRASPGVGHLAEFSGPLIRADAVTAGFILRHPSSARPVVEFVPGCYPIQVIDAVVVSGGCRTSGGAQGAIHGGMLWLRALEPSTGSTHVGWAGLPAGAVASSTSVAFRFDHIPGTVQRFRALTDAACYSVAAETPVGGQVALSGTECVDQVTGRSGFRSGTALTVEATGEYAHYLKELRVVSSETGQAVPARTIVSGAASRSIQVTVAGDMRLGVGFERCVPFSMEVVGELARYVVLETRHDCPLGEGWYRPETELRWSAPLGVVPSESNVDAYTTGEVSFSMQRRVIRVGTAGGTLRLAPKGWGCLDVGVEVRPAGAAQARLDVQGLRGDCPEGQVDATLGSVRVELTAVKPAALANAMLGIGSSGTRMDVRGTPSAVPGMTVAAQTVDRIVLNPTSNGILTLTVWVCQRLEVTTSLRNPNGGVVAETEGSRASDLIAVSTGADCPLAGASYTVGQQVGLASMANPDGYRFEGWNGQAAAAETVKVVLMDGVNPQRYVAGFSVRCFSLTTRWDEAAVTPPGNCPGQAGGSSYIGGTFVALTGIGRSGTFEGWFAPDPADLYADNGATAIVHMTEGREVYASYRGDTLRDRVANAFDSAANAVAQAAKQAIGAAAQAAKLAVMETFPVGTAMRALSIFGAGVVGVSQLLELVGVDSGWAQKVTSTISDITVVWETVTLMPMDCLTMWSAGSSGSADAVQQTWAKQVIDEISAYRALYGGATVVAKGGPDSLGDLKALASGTQQLYQDIGVEQYRTLAQLVIDTGASTPAAVAGLMARAGVYTENEAQALAIAREVLDGRGRAGITGDLSFANIDKLATLFKTRLQQSKEYQSVALLVDIVEGEADWGKVQEVIRAASGTGATASQIQRALQISQAFVAGMSEVDWNQPAGEAFSTAGFASSMEACVEASTPDRMRQIVDKATGHD